MIWEIFSLHKTRILITYGIFLVEFVLFAFLPYFLGNGIDALMAKQHFAFWLYVGLAVSGEVIGYFRRRLDTRVFVGIWSSCVSKAICALMDRGLPKEVVMTRSHLVRHYSDFYEYTLPATVSCIVNIVISCWMIFIASSTASSIILLIVLSLYLCHYFSHKIQKAELDVQDSREAVGKSISDNDKEAVASSYHTMGARLIRRSDLDALAWLGTGSISLLSQLIVVVLVANQGHTLGTIMSCIAYTNRIYERVDILGSLLNQLKQVEIADQLLEIDGEPNPTI